jgi:hypothetical protein
MRIIWCLLWLAVLIAIVLSIPLIDRTVIDVETRSGGPGQDQGQDSPLLPLPRQ